MPRILPIDPRAPTIDGVFLPAQTIREGVRIHRSLAQARNHAKHLVTEATRVAEQIRQQAICEGFQTGLVESLNMILTTLADTNALYLQIEQALKKSVQEALETALQRPDLELLLLDGWLSASTELPKKLHIIIPAGSREQQENIRQHLKKFPDISVDISVGDSNNLVIEGGEMIFEFSPDRTLEEFNALEHRCFLSLQMHHQCREWSQRIVQQWLDNLRRTDDSEESVEFSGLNNSEDGEDLDLDSELIPHHTGT